MSPDPGPRSEPIPLNVKVLLIGDPLTYYLLHEYDEDFRKLFKVKADFGAQFDRGGLRHRCCALRRALPVSRGRLANPYVRRHATLFRAQGVGLIHFVAFHD